MKNTTFVKGLFMTIVALTATTLTTTGLPSTGTGWEVLGITTAGTVMVYLAKNAVIPSVSLFNTINLGDIASGLILAVGSGLSSWAASAITSTAVNWHELLTLMGSIAVGYLAKNFIQHNNPALGVLPTQAPDVKPPSTPVAGKAA